MDSHIVLFGHTLQDESPSTENIPTSHCVKVPFCVQLNPEGHFKQDIEPAVLKVPASHD